MEGIKKARSAANNGKSTDAGIRYRRHGLFDHDSRVVLVFGFVLLVFVVALFAPLVAAGTMGLVEDKWWRRAVRFEIPPLLALFALGGLTFSAVPVWRRLLRVVSVLVPLVAGAYGVAALYRVCPPGAYVCGAVFVGGCTVLAVHACRQPTPS